MDKKLPQNQQSPETISSILERSMPRKNSEIPDVAPPNPLKETPSEGPKFDDMLCVGKKLTDESSYYDFDLAEFPWAIFSRSDRPKDGEPLIYTDTIKHPVTGRTLERSFKTFPGHLGFPTESTYQLAYVLIQMYIDQGATGDRVIFQSLSELSRRRGDRKPNGKSLERTRRDLKILGSMSIESKNACWNPGLEFTDEKGVKHKGGYEDIDTWRFFEASHYFFHRGRLTDERQLNLPISYVEVSKTFRQFAQSRGFFALGFKEDIFFSLRPLEQRLAVFLSRRFRIHQIVRRDIEALAQTLPINVKEGFNKRKKIKEISQALLDKDFPLLQSFEVKKRNGKWMAEFVRKARPTPEKPVRDPQAALALTPAAEDLINEIILLTGEPDWKWWWAVCIAKLGEQPSFRLVGNFKELYVHGDQPVIKSRGATLSDIFQREAKGRNIVLSKH